MVYNGTTFEIRNIYRTYTQNTDTGIISLRWRIETVIAPNM